MACKRLRQQKKPITIFQTDDLVLLKTNPVSNAAEGVAKKFCLVYEGPFKVIQIPHPNSYKIKDLTTGRVKGTYNTANLIPYSAM